MRPLVTSERALRVRVVKALKREGYVVYSQVTGFGGLVGRPDLVVCARGRFIALELKRPGGRVTPLQAQRLKEVRAAGGVAAVVYSVEDALTAIRED